MTTQKEQIQAIVDPTLCNQQIADYWLERLEKGELTRDDGNVSHFCCYFLPYNPATKQVFIVHHKKSGLWLSPGGHIDQGESLMQTLNRMDERASAQEFRAAAYAQIEDSTLSTEQEINKALGAGTSSAALDAIKAKRLQQGDSKPKLLSDGNDTH